MSDPIRTTCPYCGVGCGVLATPYGDGTVGIEGDPQHPANFGKLCSKGSALGETLSLEDRLLSPRMHGRDVKWSEALEAVASGFRDTMKRHGPDAVALYVSGQLLTEDYYVANKLAKGFWGTGNIDTNSRLCMASSVAGHRRAFGSDTVPGSYEDLDEADLIVLVGSNFAWCHPVLHQRILRARERRGTKLVVIDPRRTPTADDADMHLAIKPGGDVALFNTLLAHLADNGWTDETYVDAHTEGAEEAIAAARSEGRSHATGLDPLRLQRFLRLFAETKKVVTIYSQGVNQSSAGTDKVNAIVNCHLLTGRIGRPGMGPFSITGQPNAMGGREVGGLANQLAAHMHLEVAADRDRCARFWGAPAVASKPGLKAVDLFRAVKRGKIKAIWIMATNPAASMPEAAEVAAALEACPLVVVSDVTATTRTAQTADILLPALGWGEKDGTVTNSERRISRQRGFLAPPGDAKPDWWAMAQVAKRMGYDGFDYAGPADIFREHAALSAFENAGTRDFDLGPLATIERKAYDALAPVQWPVKAAAQGAERSGKPEGTARLFGNGGFFTATGKAQFVPVAWHAPKRKPSTDYPLVLNTGRIRDQWHTMTRTGKTPRLSAHLAEPFVEIHPRDAKKAALEPASIARIESALGSIFARVILSENQQEGSVFMPMHWTEPFAGRSCPDRLVQGHVDEISGQPELKATPVRVRPAGMAWHGFVLAAACPPVDHAAYWARTRVKAGWRAELADCTPLVDREEAVAELLGVTPEDEVLSFRDGERMRFVAFRDERFVGAAFFAAEPVEVARSWLADRLGERLEGQDRFRLLAGRAGADMPDRGAIVCACFDVGSTQITDAVLAGAETVDAVGQTLGAGTNCGSCRAEIRRLLEKVDVKQAG